MTTPPQTFAAAQAILAEQLPNYRRRPQQEQLARAIEATLDPADDDLNGGPLQLLAQAGTGTGKSLGAMIPAILAAARDGGGRRYIVATSTIALMNQYVTKDLPFLQDALGETGVHFTWAPLKGLANFVCKAKLAERPPIRYLDDLVEELEHEEGTPEHTGDRDSVTTPLTPAEWRQVASTSDECPGEDRCSLAEQCFGMHHKAEALTADIVVTNTAVLMTDVKVNKQIRENSETGEGAHVLLGEYDGLIVDEAHELQNTATNHLGFDIKQGGLIKYLDQAVAFLNVQEDDEGAHELQDKILAQLDDMGAVLAEALGEEERVPIDTEFLTEHFTRFENLYNELDRMVTRVVTVKISRGEQEKASNTQKRLISQGENYLDHFKEVLNADPEKVVRWAEQYGSTPRWMIKTAPIEVGPYLREELWDEYPAVLMSATLTAGTGRERFSYIARCLGLESAQTLDVGTPFDFGTQALLYYPAADVPAPAAKTREEWAAWVPAATLELVRAAKGGAMLLYTSRNAMNQAYDTIGERLIGDGYTCYLQGGDLTNKEIAARFRDDEDSVLFGLRSFMVGVDFPGRTARLVVIDKLPFAVPTDPIVKAREEAIKKRGGTPFTDLTVPAMTLTLEQAFGRLIRSTTDWGVVAIMDSRLASKGYGRKIVRSLPDAMASTSMDDVRTFYDAWENAPALRAAA